MKGWHTLAFIGGLLLLCILVILYHKFTTATTMALEAFQSAVASLPPETPIEQEAYDMFEYENQQGLASPPPTLIPPYDGSTSLAEFDDTAPIPWDFDNRASDPADILWGSVDSRGSMELRERAYMRAVFFTANNVEVADNGNIGYYSTKLNGAIFYDPQQIVAVKYLEFAMDTASEELIEGALGKLAELAVGGDVDLMGQAAAKARATVDAEMLKPENAGKLKSQVLTELEAAEINRLTDAKKAAGTLPPGRMSKLAKAQDLISLGPLQRAVGRATAPLRDVLKRAFRRALQPLKTVFTKLTRSSLNRLGPSIAGKIAAKFAVLRATKIAAQQALRRTILAPFYSIPIWGQILAVVMELLNLMFLVVIPQILADYVDLEEDPMGSSCDSTFQGCPSSHPFNLRCAIIKAVGDAFWEVFIAIPTLGDSIGTFAPYICSARDLSAVFRQSFRPPPYYFDSTLSIFFTEKPKILSGNLDGTGADRMYYNPGFYKLKPEGNNVPVSSDQWSTHFHPWVDFTHKEMLNKMAQFYYEKAIQNATVDVDGWATFQVIEQFKGLIASSQYSCDVQVTLKEIKYRPFSGEIAPGWPKAVPNPYETAESIDTGCSYHDRRFYFTWDFTKAGMPNLDLTKTAPAITEDVLSWCDRLSVDGRLGAFRDMCVPVGCTHENGTAADVVDITPDGEPIADAPVGLGVQGQGYLPPAVSMGDLATLPVQDDANCGTFRSKLNRFGTNYTQPGRGKGLKDKPSPQEGRVIYQTSECDYTAGLLDTTPTRRRMFSTRLASGATAPSTQPIRVASTASLPNGTGGTIQIVSGSTTYIYENTLAVGDLIHVNGPIVNGSLTQGKDYIFWNKEWIMNGETCTETIRDLATPTWQVYNPKPTWTNSTDMFGADLTWLNGTTKLWKELKVERSQKQRIFAGVQGGLTALLPLKFGMAGGLYATTMDAAGISSALACTYQDALSEQGNFVLNGFTVTSQPKFVVGRGPIILYAPGYTPQITNRCGNFRVNQAVCSNRVALRRLAQQFQKAYPDRRLARLISSRPDVANRRCNYAVNSVGVADGADVPGSERSERVAIPYSISGSSTLEQTCTMSPGEIILGLPTREEISPVPIGSADTNPPLKQSEMDSLSTGTIRRATTCTTFVNCDDAALKARITSQFNALYEMGETPDPANPANKIKTYSLTATLGASKTPLVNSTFDANGNKTGTGITDYKPGISAPTCVYNATFKADKLDGTNQTVDLAPTILTVTLNPRAGTTCEYDLETHDYPIKYFPAPLPKNGPFSFPRPATQPTTLPALAGCTPSPTDCSGVDLIDRLVSQFNGKYTDRKILRVLRAYTPATGATPTAPLCDYEVDMQRTAGGNSFTERDTVRFTLRAPTAGCLWDLASDGSAKRQSGGSIDTNTVAQVLKSDYIWPVNYITTVRKALNSFIAPFIQLDVPGTVDKAARSTRDKLTTLSRAVQGQTIQGCTDGSTGSRCQDTSTLNAFMNRYAFDNSPPYPQGQFGSTVRTIVGWRLAGLAGPRECHVELVEREEYVTNWVIKRREAPDNTSAETARFFVRQYSFAIAAASMSGGACVITPRMITSAEIQARSFEILGEPYGINVPGAEIPLGTVFDFAPKAINPVDQAVMTAMKLAVDAFKPRAVGYVSQAVVETVQVLNARPNVVEYRVKLSETIRDPDFGLQRNTGIDAIVVATWTEQQWSPITGAFTPAGSVPSPTVDVFVPGRVRIINRQVTFDGVTYANPPYLYWPVPPFDPKTQESRIRDERWVFTIDVKTNSITWKRPAV